MKRDMITGSAPLTRDLEAVAKALRRSTVQVRQRGSAKGSGVIWRSTGLIITNAHVVRGQPAIVKLYDERFFTASILFEDLEHDLAALQVGATGLPSISAADSSKLRVGELVFAVGNPSGVFGALTAGIVHTLGTSKKAPRPKWIRADLNLPRGYSGGPLADARGWVIGINSMAKGELALAVPSNTVESFLRRHN